VTYWEVTFKASGVDGETANPNATVLVDAKAPGKVLARWRPAPPLAAGGVSLQDPQAVDASYR
jgi:hypothetical protein